MKTRIGANKQIGYDKTINLNRSDLPKPSISSGGRMVFNRPITVEKAIPERNFILTVTDVTLNKKESSTQSFIFDSKDEAR